MSVDLIVRAGPQAWLAGRALACAVGGSGFSRSKREGDGATPVAALACRAVFYRPDRLARPVTALPCRALTAADGWCDDPADQSYNRAVTLPYPARAERLWREDHVYDLIVPLGWNDDPVVPGAGSAIFLHLARDDFRPTEGCVALALADLLDFLGRADQGSRVVVEA